jgi:hypothetical protein
VRSGQRHWATTVVGWNWFSGVFKALVLNRLGQKWSVGVVDHNIHVTTLLKFSLHQVASRSVVMLLLACFLSILAVVVAIPLCVVGN